MTKGEELFEIKCLKCGKTVRVIKEDGWYYTTDCYDIELDSSEGYERGETDWSIDCKCGNRAGN